MELAYTIPAAIGLGALHALEPGHGKGVISAYLIATRGKIKDALLIGVISAISHTLSIILLSFVASSAIHWLAPEHMMQWIEIVSGILITLIGAKILYGHYYPKILSIGPITSISDSASCDHDHCSHHHHHHHAHDNEKSEAPRSLFRLAMVSIFTGIIPCPSAVAIFLAATAANQISFGVELVSAFSLGSALSMCAIGIVVVRVEKTIKQQRKHNFGRSLQFASSLLIIGIGLFVTFHSIGHFHI